MLYVVVNGLWGPREETVRSIAERWSGTLTALRDIDGTTFDVWHEAGDDLPSDPVLAPSVPALAEYIERKNTGPDLDVVGYTSSLWVRNPGAAYVSLATHAGGTSRYAPHSVSLVFRSREVDETAEVIRRAPEILRVLAEHWEIDAYQVYDKPVYEAVAERFDLENSDPRCGRAVHLSMRPRRPRPRGPARNIRPHRTRRTGHRPHPWRYGAPGHRDGHRGEHTTAGYRFADAAPGAVRPRHVLTPRTRERGTAHLRAEYCAAASAVPCTRERGTSFRAGPASPRTPAAAPPRTPRARARTPRASAPDPTPPARPPSRSSPGRPGRS